MPLVGLAGIWVLPARTASGLASGGGIGIRSEGGLLRLAADDRDRPDPVSRGVSEANAAGNSGNSGWDLADLEVTGLVPSRNEDCCFWSDLPMPAAATPRRLPGSVAGLGVLAPLPGESRKWVAALA